MLTLTANKMVYWCEKTGMQTASQTEDFIWCKGAVLELSQYTDPEFKSQNLWFIGEAGPFEHARVLELIEQFFSPVEQWEKVPLTDW